MGRINATRPARGFVPGRKEKDMKKVFTLTRRADGLNDYVFDTLTEAVAFARDQEFDDDVYEIHKILDDNGYEAECLEIYDLSGENVE
jgi:hypothetical protein